MEEMLPENFIKDTVLTRFPDLNSDTIEELSLKSHRTCALISPVDHEATIILSWAFLLNSYTGDDELRFIVDDSIVTVQMSTWAIRKSQCVEAISVASDGTGILTRGRVRDKDLALQLIYEQEIGDFRLLFSSNVPHDHHDQFILQLKAAVNFVLNQSTISTTISSKPEPSPSIANYPPKRLYGSRFLHQLVNQDVPRSAPAVEFWDHKGQRTILSYQALEEQSTNLALHLSRIRTRRDVSLDKPGIVALLLPQSIALYVSILAVLRTGSAFCPLATDAPIDRLKFVIEDVAADIIITMPSLASRVPENYENFPTVVIFDDNWDAEKNLEAKNLPSPDMRDDDFAYIYYTSGSTGSPKGVAVPHCSVVQSLLAHDYHVPHFSRFLQFAAPTFDVFIFELFFPLYRGKTVVSRNRADLLLDLPGFIDETNIDAAELTPTVAGNLLQKRANVPSLKLLLTIGEMLTQPVIQEFGATADNAGILHAVYGPTECAIHCAHRPNFPSNARTGIIGKPLETVSAFIITTDDFNFSNEGTNFMPVGQLGELAIGGYQLATEYVNRPEESSVSFIRTQAFGVLYRTGDMARLLPDGNLEMLGRINTGQVKLRGQRVELGEIENTITLTEGCVGACVMIIDSVLVAFCVCRSREITAEELEASCKRWLPPHMIPGKIVLLEKFPYLASGKMDRSALQQIYKESYIVKASPLGNSSQLINDICILAAEVLGHSVSINSRLYNSGLDSLKAIKFASLLRRNGYDIQVSDLVEAETLQEVANYILQKSAKADVNSQPMSPFAMVGNYFCHEKISALLKSSEVDKVIQCTPTQMAMLSQTLADSSMYCNWILLRFSNIKDGTTVRSYFDKLAEANEILRSGFIASNPMAQVIWKELTDEQIIEVDQFEKSYSIKSDDDFLRPFQVQLMPCTNGSLVLLHLPHFMYDGWSLDLILADLSELCAEKELEPRPQYREVSNFYQKYHEYEEYEISRQFWRTQIGDISPCFLSNYNGHRMDKNQQLTCTKLITLNSQDSCLRQDLKPYTCQSFFQSAFAYLLCSYYGKHDITFGLVTSGRTLPVAGIDRIVGPCLNTVPVRIRLSTMRTTGDLLQNVYDMNREIMKYGLLPLRDIKALSNLQKGMPMFEALFNWQETLGILNKPKREEVQQVDSADLLEFKLVLEIVPEEQNIQLRLRYHSSVFPTRQAKIFLDQVEELTRLLAKSQQILLADLSQSLSYTTLSTWNRSQREEPFIHPVTVIRNMAKTSPNAPAVKYFKWLDGEKRSEQIMSYKELHEYTNRLAKAIRDTAAINNDIIAICMSKSIDAYATILSTVKAGYGYLFITPETPDNRKKAILEQSGANLFLSLSHISRNLIFTSHLIILDIDKLKLSGFTSIDLHVRSDENALAYATFTSGTSGKPKGVQVTLKNLQSNIQVLSDQYPATRGDHLLQFCSLSFDVSVFDIFYSWCTGMCICAADNDILFRDLERAIEIMNISHLSLTPTVASLLDVNRVPYVRFLVTAGEAVTDTLIRNWAKTGLYQGYGPSETTNICTIKPKVTLEDLSSNIGYSLRNTSVYILEEDNYNIVPRGGLGELCFGGDQVARGYIGFEVLENKKFIIHPHCGRLYRSGDLGRLLPDGSILFQGRLDTQIKIRGQRVEIGELNSCILKVPFVRDCGSTLVKSKQGEGQRPTQLLSFWIPSCDFITTENILLRSMDFNEQITVIFQNLVAELPSYMIPAHLIPISRIPMTNQGKVDTNALSALFLLLDSDALSATAQNAADIEQDEPLSDTEKSIAEAISELLGIPIWNIRQHTSFLSLGLDSITAVPLSKTLSVPLSSILKYASVASLARILKSKLVNGHVESTTKLEITMKDLLLDIQQQSIIDNKNIKKVLPCTPLQEAMLSATEVSEGARYMNRMLFKVTGNYEALREAWNLMVERHDILKTVFIAVSNRRYSFAQVVLKKYSPRWIGVSEANNGFNSESENYYETLLFQSGAAGQPSYCLVEKSVEGVPYLLFLCHHALYDGIAMENLLKEIELCYHGVPLPPAIQYEPYLNQMLNFDREAADKFWSQHLHNFRPMEFPKLKHYVKYASLSNKYCSVKGLLSRSLDHIEMKCKELSINLLSLGQAVWTKLLSAYLGKRDVCFGNVVSGRDLDILDIQGLVAPCFNTLPVRMDIARYTRNIDLANKLKEHNIDYLPFQLTSLREIKQSLGIKARRIFDTLFLLQLPRNQLDPSIWSLEEDIGDMDLAVVLELQPNRENNSIHITVSYESNYMSNETADLVLKQYDALLASFLQYPAAQVHDFGVLSDDLLATSKGCSLEKMSANLVSKETLRQSQYHLSDKYSVISTDTGKVLPLFGVGELHANITLNSETSHTTNYLQNPSHQLTHKAELQRTGICGRMLSSDSIKVVPSINSISKESLSGQSSDVTKLLKSAFGGVTEVLLYKPWNPELFDYEALVVFEAEKESSEGLIDVRNAIEPQVQSIFTTRKKRVLYVTLDNIPRIGDGIDVACLRDLLNERVSSECVTSSEEESNKNPIGNMLYEDLRKIYSRLSNVPIQHIQPETSIFQLGFDSITAIQISSQLRSRGRHIAAATILEHPTIKELIKSVDYDRIEEDPGLTTYDFRKFEHEFWSSYAGVYPQLRENIEMVRPCTHMQEGLLSQFISSGGQKYFNHFEYTTSSELDRTKLYHAWEEVVSRHPILRTGFVPLTDTDHCFAMIVYREGRSKPLIEIRSDSASLHREIQVTLAQSADAALNNLYLPPWRVLLSFENGKTSINILALHALYDAHSIQIVLDNLDHVISGNEFKGTRSFDPLLRKLLSNASNEEASAEEYWRSMKDNISVSNFPNLTTTREKTSETYTIRRPQSQDSAAWNHACREANATTQAVAQAAWARLLAAYLGVQDVTFGVILSGRTDVQDQDIAFPCISTVPFSLNVQRSDVELLQQVMNWNKGMLKHQHTPLTKIQRWIGRANENLFDTVLVYQKSLTKSHQVGSWRLANEMANTEYALSIELQPEESGNLLLNMTSRSDVLAKDQAQILLSQYDQALSQIVSFPQVSQSKLLQHYPTLLSHISPKEDEIPLEETLLHDFVETIAQKYPENVAIEFFTDIWPSAKKETWSYKELDMLGNKVAHLILNHVNSKGLIAVCFDKCPTAYIAILGILKSGNAFVALDPSAPRARKDFILKDSGACLVLGCGEAYKEIGHNTDIPTLNLDEINLHVLPGSPLHFDNVSASDICYCLYTSGSTGTAKGCDITHENAVQAMGAFHRLFAGNWHPGSRWLQFASFHFDVSVLEQYWSWSAGITLVSASRDLILQDLAMSIRKMGVTHIDLTPSLARTIDPKDVPSLCKGIFIVGGEALTVDIIETWGQYGVIYNGYGPTETTIGVTMLPRLSATGKPSNIGWQFDNVGSFILSAETQDLVPRGGIGELCIYGKLVGSGYRNRPEITKERYPYHPTLKVRYYRTGDLVRLLHNGTFDYIGRLDLQVKLRGQRLELGEIDAVIRSRSEEVVDVATVLLKHQRTLKDILVSFVVMERDTRNSNSDEDSIEGTEEHVRLILRTCSTRLPPYMVPTYVIPLPSIPLTANNKVDKMKLEEAFESWSTVNGLERLPMGAEDTARKLSLNQQKICDVLSKVLHTKLENVSPSSNFFNLGLDSITMIKFVHVLRIFGFTNAQTLLVMQNPTISSLEKALTSSKPQSDEIRTGIAEAQQRMAVCMQQYQYEIATKLGVPPDVVDRICPCTPIQEGMILRSLESANELYFMAFYYELQPEVNTAKLRSAWERAFNSIPILRVKIMSTQNGHVQVLLRDRRLPWNEVKSREDENIELELDSLRKSWIAKNGDDLLYPFEIVLLNSKNKKTLVIHIFHGLYDAISLSRLMSCVAEEHENDSSLVAYGPDYFDCLPYGPLLRMSTAKSYWTNYLAQIKPLSMPQLVDTPAEKDISVAIDFDSTDAFDARRQDLNVTSQALIQACWISILREYVGNLVTIGLVISGRSIDVPNAAEIIGPLFNTIPFSVEVSSDDTYGILAKKCHEVNTTSMKYHHTPLRDIVKWTRDKHGTPLFDTLFSFQSYDESHSPQDRLWRETSQTAQSDFSLALEVQQISNTSMRLILAARKDISNEKKSLEILSRFREAMEQALDQPDSLLSDYVITYKIPKASEGMRSRTSTETLVETVEDPQSVARLNLLRTEIAKLASVAVDDVKRNSSVFEFGLDSIDVMKLSSRLKAHGFSLLMTSIMRHPIVQEIALRLKADEQTERESSSGKKYFEKVEKLRGSLEQSNVDTHDLCQLLPATPLQESLVAQMINSNYARYFTQDVLRIQSNVDVNRLKDAWLTVYNKSPILQTSFVEIDDPSVEDSFAQVIRKGRNFTWKEITVPDISHIDLILNQVKEDMIQRGMSSGLFALALVYSGDQKYLIVSLSHALYDGWSISLLHNDVSCVYHEKYVERPGYETVIQRIYEESSDKSLAFWSSYLSRAKSSLIWPELSPQMKNETTKANRHEMISSVSSARLEEFCRQNRFTIQAISQTCFALVLASYVHSLEVCFGTTVSGRDSEEDLEILFPMMNTVVFHSILFGTRLEMVRYTQENMSSIRPHQQFPLRKALATRKLDGNKLFNTLFIYQKQQHVQSSSQQLYESISGVAEAEFPLCVEMEVVNSKTVWRLACSSFLAEEGFGVKFLGNLDVVLENILNDPAESTFVEDHGKVSICGLESYPTEEARINDDSKEVGHPVGFNGSESSWTELELTLRDAFSAVSGTAASMIDKNVSIFHLGIDSISVVKVAAFLRNRGINISVSQILRAQSIHAMASIVEQNMLEKDREQNYWAEVESEMRASLDFDTLLEKNGLSSSNVQYVMPATPVQVYMLAMWEKSEGALFYPIFTFRLQRSVDYMQICNAWQSLVSKVPMLRTVFIFTQNVRYPVVQVVLKDFEDSIHGNAEHDDQIGFSILTQPFVRLQIAFKDDSWLLKLHLHHALYDAFSLRKIKDKFTQLLRAESSPSESVKPFSNYVALYNANRKVEKRRIFWTEYLLEAKPLQLHLAAAAELLRTEIFRTSLIRNVANIENIAKNNGLTMGAIFLATYARLYAQFANLHHENDQSVRAKDAVFGVYLANRGVPVDDLSDKAVPVLNLVPLHVKKPCSSTILNSAKNIQQDLQEIGNGNNTLVALWEIKQWTGIVLDSFVNILGNLDDNDYEEQTSGSDEIKSDIRLEEVEVGGVNSSPLEPFRPNIGMLNDSVREAYKMSLDIELSIKKGALDVGVFVPSNLMTTSEANGLLDDFGAALGALSDDGNIDG